MYIYEVAPIDWWEPWQTEADYQHRIEAEHGPEAHREWEGYLALKERALDLARGKGWEGDFRQGPFISGLPPINGDSGSKVMIAWKQDNNGTCFIASPFRLPWLHE